MPPLIVDLRFVDADQGPQVKWTGSFNGPNETELGQTPISLEPLVATDPHEGAAELWDRLFKDGAYILENIRKDESKSLVLRLHMPDETIGIVGRVRSLPWHWLSTVETQNLLNGKSCTVVYSRAGSGKLIIGKSLRVTIGVAKGKPTGVHEIAGLRPILVEPLLKARRQAESHRGLHAAVFFPGFSYDVSTKSLHLPCPRETDILIIVAHGLHHPKRGGSILLNNGKDELVEVSAADFAEALRKVQYLAPVLVLACCNSAARDSVPSLVESVLDRVPEITMAAGLSSFAELEDVSRYIFDLLGQIEQLPDSAAFASVFASATVNYSRAAGVGFTKSHIRKSGVLDSKGIKALREQLAFTSAFSRPVVILGPQFDVHLKDGGENNQIDELRREAFYWAEQSRFPFKGIARLSPAQVFDYIDNQWPESLGEEVLASARQRLSGYLADAATVFRSLGEDHPYRLAAKLRVPIFINLSRNRCLYEALDDAGRTPIIKVFNAQSSPRDIAEISSLIAVAARNLERPGLAIVDPQDDEDTKRRKKTSAIILHPFGYMDNSKPSCVAEMDLLDWLLGGPVSRPKSDLMPPSLMEAIHKGHLWLLGVSLEHFEVKVFLVWLKSMFEADELHASTAVLVGSETHPESRQYPSESDDSAWSYLRDCCARFLPYRSRQEKNLRDYRCELATFLNDVLGF